MPAGDCNRIMRRYLTVYPFANSPFTARTFTICIIALLIGSTSLPQATADQPRWSESRMKGTPEPPPPLEAQLAFDHKFTKPVLLTAVPGTPQLLVAEQDGKLLTLGADRQAEPHLWMDLKEARPELTNVYGFAFHPNFPQDPTVFICYTVRGDPQVGTRVSRFRTAKEAPYAWNADSEEVLLTWLAGGHNGGCLKFGPEGYLYISTGDASPPTPPDPNLVGQDLTNLLSCVLRIDVDQRSEGRPYRVPPDNPFVATDGALPEIWAYGFRNPWKMNFDDRGNLWLGDVGWELWEMIYRVERGGNYGWSIMEGPQVVLQEQEPGPTPIQPPIVYHPHSEAASITGGMVYRRQKLPQLRNHYIYGDFQSGIVWAFRWENGEVVDHRVIAKTSVQLVAFGSDSKGELYLVDYRGQIFQLQDNQAVDQSGEFPKLLSQTGLFAATAEHRVATGVIPYNIVAPAWADHTEANRWLAVPPGDGITMDSKGNWQFPNGSVVFKTVSMPNALAKPGAAPETRRLETQVLHRYRDSWRPYTYVWSEDQQDAELAPATGDHLKLLIADKNAPRGLRHQTYRVAGRKECFLCHNSWVEAKTTIFGEQSSSLLGLNTEQLDCTAPGTTNDQLQQLVDGGLLASRPETKAKPLVNPYDVTAKLDDRARSYLHVNCSHCHQFNAGGVATIALGREVGLQEMGLLNARPAQGTFGLADARIVAPGDPFASILLYRIAKTGSGRMPRIGSQHVDEAGVQLIRDWISFGLEAGDRADDVVAMLDEIDRATSPQAGAEKIARFAATTRGALAMALNMDRIPNPDHRETVAAEVVRDAPIEIVDLFERYLPPQSRRQRLGAVVDYDEILSLSSDREKGKNIFFNHQGAACKNCHKIANVGVDIGPPLDSIGKKYKSRRLLLEHILEPSKYIEPVYVPYLVETADGRVLTGLLESKTDKEIALRDSKNQVHRLPADEVELLVRQQKSMMPDLILKDLTAQEVADLLGYLASLRK